jgi:hypothetical protein
MANNDRLEELLEASIQAQNRTTHAVRALSSFVLIQAAWGLAAGIFFGLGIANPNSPSFVSFVFILGSLLLVAGFIHSIIRAFLELEESKSLVSAGVVSSPVIKSTTFSDKGALTKPVASAAKPQGVIADSDFFIAQQYLSDDEVDAWDEQGMPSLESWLQAGRPPFLEWLKKQKR